MTTEFFKFRAQKIREWVKIEKPLLIVSWRNKRYLNAGNGHIRYSRNFYDYEQTMLDFKREWIRNPPRKFSTYYNRMTFMRNLKPHRKLTEWMIMDMFEESPYGKMKAGFRKV